jgi:hypothetical protein
MYTLQPLSGQGPFYVFYGSGFGGIVPELNRFEIKILRALISAGMASKNENFAMLRPFSF